MGIISEEIKNYDPYTDKFIKNSTTDRIEIGTDGNLYRLSVSNGNEYLSNDRLYTKADMVKELKELQKKIDEYQKDAFYADDVMIRKRIVKDIIQQKIDELKENK